MDPSANLEDNAMRKEVNVTNHEGNINQNDKIHHFRYVRDAFFKKL